MVLTVDTFNPANTVTTAGKFVSTAWRKFNTRTLFNFFTEVIYANTFKGVLGFRIFTIYTVTPVTLRSYNCFSNSQRVLKRNKTKVISFARIGRFIAVRHGQTATNEHVKTYQFTVFSNGDKVQIVCVYVHIVLRRDHNRCLKLTWQVVVTQNRLLISGFQTLAI